jgi:hypothetical protein
LSEYFSDVPALVGCNTLLYQRDVRLYLCGVKGC